MKAWRKHMPKRPPCHSHSCTATMIGCHHTAISTVTHNIAVHKHTHVYKCRQTHTYTHNTNAHIHRRTHTHTQDPRLWKSAPASTTLTTKSLLSLQLFLHWGLTTHQKSLSLWEQHETTASSPLDATCHIKYLIICYSIFPIKLEMFTMHIHTIIYHSVVNANWDDKAGLAVKKKRKKKRSCIAVLLTVRRLRWILERVIACCGSILFSADKIWPETKKNRDTEITSFCSISFDQTGGGRVNFFGPGCCQQAEGSYVMSLIGGRWRWDQWQGCAMDAILAGLWCAVCRPGFTRKESLENTAGCHSKRNVV